jgi:hypothetical protein
MLVPGRGRWGMSADDNKRVVAEFVERCQNQHDLAFADEAFHPKFVITTGRRVGLSRRRIGRRAASGPSTARCCRGFRMPPW